MVARIFRNSPTREAALTRLGAAVVLHWAAIPPDLQQMLEQQALAMSDDDIRLHAEIVRLTKLSRTGDQ
jgi:hypothetical protein